jgi:hypothetical protein
VHGGHPLAGSEGPGWRGDRGRGIPGDCQRTTQIDAAPDGKLIQMQVDIDQDGVRVARFHFEMQRLAQQDRAPRR